jgi:hypothetical protein
MPGGSGTETAEVKPIIPKAGKPIANLMMQAATALMGSPVNWAKNIPGFDAAPAGPLIPEANFGNALSSQAYQMGANRLPVSSSGSVRPVSGYRPVDIATTNPVTEYPVYTSAVPSGVTAVDESTMGKAKVPATTGRRGGRRKARFGNALTA